MSSVVLAAGRLADLLGSGCFEFDVDDLDGAGAALRGMDGVATVQQRGGRLA